MKLKGKVAIVTGAASGMGKAIAEKYALEGAKVIAADLNIEGAKAVVEKIKEAKGEAYPLQVNVTSDKDIEQLFSETIAHYGKLDILVNNAGIMDGFEPVNEVEDSRWNLLFAVNTTSVMKTMRKAMKLFLEQGSGTIINNISAGGLHGGRAGAAYTASKHAVVGLTKNTAFMYAENSKIRCNGIAPGGVETNIQSSIKQASEYGMAQQGKGNALMPRVGKPEEIANLAAFLASEDASFINGQVIVADAGWTTF